MDMSNKITILGLILQNKNLLFGRFSEQVTHEKKINKWKEIAEQLKALGIFNKDWKYLRDTTWQNWRKRTIEKRDNRLQTGSAGGKKCKYDESDDLIFRIIGKDSPVIDGLPTLESSGSNEETVFVPASSSTVPTVASIPENSETPPVQRPIYRRSQNPRVSISETEVPNELVNLKKQKMEIEIEILKEKLEIARREKYKLDLELLKSERELNVQPSKFTLPLYVQNVQIIDADTLRNDRSIHIIQSDESHEQEEDILQRAVNETL